MTYGDFQFLSGLLEVCIALHIGFAASDGIRSLARKKFEAYAGAAIALAADDHQSDEIRERLKREIAHTKRKISASELRKIHRSMWCGSIAIFLLVLVSSSPLAGEWVRSHYYGIYAAFFTLGVIFLIVIAHAYVILYKKWGKALDRLESQLKIIFGMPTLDNLMEEYK